VTGAGSGIGRALSLAYAAAGCSSLAMADINYDGVQETSKMINEKWPSVGRLEIKVDVSDPTSVDAMVKTTIEKFGKLDYAANVAGISCKMRHESAPYPLDEYDQIQAVNARGLLICVQAEIRAMKINSPTISFKTSPLPCDPRRAQRGSIINIASVCGFSLIPKIMPYTVSKHAVLGITRSFAVEHAKDGIRVNAVCPGVVETPMFSQLQKSGGEFGEFGVTPMGRICLAEEVADASVFLSSSLSSYMVGQMVVIDGGRSVTY